MSSKQNDIKNNPHNQYLVSWIEKVAMDKFRGTKYFKKIDSSVNKSVVYTMKYIEGDNKDPRFTVIIEALGSKFSINLVMNDKLAIKLINPSEYNAVLTMLSYLGKQGKGV